MLLYTLSEFYPTYKEKLFDGDDIKGITVYTANIRDKIGTIDDVLVDEQGRFRYFVIDTGFWVFGKRVLLPVNYCKVEPRKQRIFALNIYDKGQIEDLVHYSDAIRSNRSYEQRNRGVQGNSEDKLLTSVVPLEASPPLDLGLSNNRDNSNIVNNTLSYNYQTEPSLYNNNTQEYQTLKLYEERLFADKKKRQSGEVVVAKHIETEKAKISVPLEREKVVIERTLLVNPKKIDLLQNNAFWEGEITRLKVYEETVDIRKEAFVREEIKIMKEVEQDTVEVEETLRREELDIDTNNRELIDNKFIS